VSVSASVSPSTGSTPGRTHELKATTSATARIGRQDIIGPV
jgi:hypothetical protein